MPDATTAIDIDVLIQEALKRLDTLDKRLRKVERSGQRVEKQGQKINTSLGRAFAGNAKIVAGFNSVVQRGVQNLLGYATSIFGLIVIFGLLRRAIRGVVDVMSDFERLVISIQSLLAGRFVFGGARNLERNFQLAGEAARSVVGMLRIIERRSPAALDELAEGFQTAVATGVAEMTRTLEDALELSSLLVTAANLYDRQVNQSLSNLTNIRAVMTGVASQHALVARLVESQVGPLGEWVQRVRQTKTGLEEIKEIFPALERASTELGNSWQGIVTSVRTIAKDLTRLVFGGVFDSLKSFLRSFRDGFNQVRSAVVRFVVTVQLQLRLLLDLFKELFAFLVGDFLRVLGFDAGAFMQTFLRGIDGLSKAVGVLLIALTRLIGVFRELTGSLDFSGPKAFVASLVKGLRDVVPKALSALTGAVAEYDRVLAEAIRRGNAVFGGGAAPAGVPRANFAQQLEQRLKFFKFQVEQLKELQKGLAGQRKFLGEDLFINLGLPTERGAGGEGLLGRILRPDEFEPVIARLQTRLRDLAFDIDRMFKRETFLGPRGLVFQIKEFAAVAAKQSPEIVGGLLLQRVAVAKLREELMLLGEAFRNAEAKGSRFSIQLNDSNETVLNFESNVRAALAGVGNVFADLFTDIFSNQGEDSLKRFFAGILSVIGDFMIQLGIAAINLAIAIEALKSLNPVALIAIGVALIAFGGVLKGIAASAAGGFQGGRSGGPGSSPFEPIFVQPIPLSTLPPSGVSSSPTVSVQSGGAGLVRLAPAPALELAVAGLHEEVRALRTKISSMAPGDVVTTALDESGAARGGIRTTAFEETQLSAAV